MKERFTQLDSMRGLAAITVMFSHLIFIPLQNPQSSAYFSDLSPLKLFISGHEAVILFFMLSGFVLSLPILGGRAPSYPAYIVRRWFRIYVPYIVSFLIGWGLIYLSPKLKFAHVSEFLNSLWTRNISMDEVWRHVEMIFMAHTKEVDFVYWSLVHEMRISLLFPFIVLLFSRLKWFYTVGIGLLLTAVGVANLVFSLQWSDNNTSYYDTAYYLSFFLYGMLLAKHRTSLVAWFQRRGKAFKYAFLVACLVCYNSSNECFTLLKKVGISIPAAHDDPVVALGVAGLMVICLSSGKASQALESRIPAFLGRISYSLYLYHTLVIMAIVHSSIAEHLSALTLGVIAAVVSILVSYLAWLLVEKPAMQLGKNLTSKKRLSQPAIAHHAS